MPAASLRILFVHPDLLHRAKAAFTIWQLGHWSDVVPSAKRALSAMQHHAYNLVFIAMNIPGLDGYATARSIRACESESGFQSSLICMISEADDSEAQQFSRDAGIDACICDASISDDIRKMIRLAETLALLEVH